MFVREDLSERSVGWAATSWRLGSMAERASSTGSLIQGAMISRMLHL